MTPLLFTVLFLTLSTGQTYRFQREHIAVWGPPVFGFGGDKDCHTVLHLDASDNAIYCVKETPERVDEMILGRKLSDLPPR